MTHLAAVSIAPETLAAARAGDRRAREAIYRACLPGVRGLVRRLVTRPATAEEIAHDVFVQVLKGLDSFEGSGPFGAWVRSIAVTRSLMHLRSPWNRAALWLDKGAAGEEGGDPTDVFGQVEEPVVRSRLEELRLERALATLTPLARSVVWLHDVEGYTHAEIASELGRSTSFSKSQLARAHERLRGLLANSEETIACTPASSSC